MVNNTGAMVAGGIGGAALALLAKGASAKPADMDTETWELMQTLLASNIEQGEQIETLVASIKSLILTLGGSPPDDGGYDAFENTASFTTGQVICTTINTGFRLPSIPIPKNKSIVVKALPGNVTWIFAGRITSDAQNQGVAYILVPNEGFGLQIKDASQIWVMALTLNDGVVYMVEQ